MGWRSRRASLIQCGDGRGQVSGQMATADTRENGQMALFVPMDPLVTAQVEFSADLAHRDPTVWLGW
jgi:hypothetical protein